MPKLDCLGRDAIDVSTTVKTLAEMGVRVYCLALGGADLTSSAGTMTMNGCLLMVATICSSFPASIGGFLNRCMFAATALPAPSSRPGRLR